MRVRAPVGAVNLQTFWGLGSNKLGLNYCIACVLLSQRLSGQMPTFEVTACNLGFRMTEARCLGSGTTVWASIFRVIYMCTIDLRPPSEAREILEI